MNTLSLASLFLLISVTAARAQPAIAEPSSPSTMQSTSTPPDPTVAITVSPLHMFVPMAEVTAELRLAPKLGISVIGGVGSFRTETMNDKVLLLEVGGSARYYLTGSFRGGVQLGGEAVYVHASTTDRSLEVKAAGLGLSPFVGYKWTHRSGFTLEAQGGPSFMVARARSSSVSASERKIGPMLNLQAGWSF